MVEVGVEVEVDELVVLLFCTIPTLLCESKEILISSVAENGVSE
jgi:hypothetical protein